jgi:cation transport regulator
MPYSKPEELPPRVRNHLPSHARHIFLKAFNNAWTEYAKPSKRASKKESHEEVAFKVAWAAVGHTYEKKGEHWVRKAS